MVDTLIPCFALESKEWWFAARGYGRKLEEVACNHQLQGCVSRGTKVVMCGAPGYLQKVDQLASLSWPLGRLVCQIVSHPPLRLQSDGGSIYACIQTRERAYNDLPSSMISTFVSFHLLWAGLQVLTKLMSFSMSCMPGVTAPHE